MTSYDYVTVGVFTSQRFGGNPLAVFPKADGLSDGQMQAIAAEFNLSETAFVLPPDNPQHHAKVRIFTQRPKFRLPVTPMSALASSWRGLTQTRRSTTRSRKPRGWAGTHSARFRQGHLWRPDFGAARSLA